MPRVTVIGIGSAIADDRAGWSVADALVASKEIAALGSRVLVSVCDSPASELLPLLADAGIAILVDAVRFSGAPGTVYRLGGGHFEIPATTSISSHGVDLPTMLSLAFTLQQSPRMIIIYGIEGNLDLAADSPMSPCVSRAVKRVTEDIKRDIAYYCANK